MQSLPPEPSTPFQAKPVSDVLFSTLARYLPKDIQEIDEIKHELYYLCTVFNQEIIRLFYTAAECLALSVKLHFAGISFHRMFIRQLYF